MDDTPILDAVLRPNPPADPRVLRAILIAVLVINLAFGLYFVSRGAWPIFPFMGLDVALLYWAFRASVRAAKRFERVTLTQENLLIARHPVKGPATQIALNPYWVRVEMDDPPEHWSQLTLWSHGKAYRVGTFLAPAQRFSFAQMLKNALRRTRETHPA